MQGTQATLLKPMRFGLNPGEAPVAGGVKLQGVYIELVLGEDLRLRHLPFRLLAQQQLAERQLTPAWHCSTTWTAMTIDTLC
jgi:hypothetical protein